METDTEWGNVNEEMQLKHNEEKRPEGIEDFNEKIPP
jgi:hypothetical protein